MIPAVAGSKPVGHPMTGQGCGLNYLCPTDEQGAGLVMLFILIALIAVVVWIIKRL